MKVYPESVTREFNGIWYGSTRAKIAKQISERAKPTWGDFVKLEAQLGREWKRVSEYRITDFLFDIYSFNLNTRIDKELAEAMLKILTKFTPQKLNYKYSESNLMLAANLGLGNFWCSSSGESDGGWSTPSKAMISATKALRIILEKIGDSLPDEEEIIKKMVSANHAALRSEGYATVTTTYKHKWRHDVETLETIIRSVLDEGHEAYKRGEVKGTAMLVFPALLKANPECLFWKHNDTDEYILYKGKDTMVEDILIDCSREKDPRIRGKAFHAIDEYLQRHKIDNPTLDEALINGVEKLDEYALCATYFRLKYGLIKNPKLFPLLVKAAGNSVLENRFYALTAIGEYLEKERINDDRLKPLCRKYFNDENENMRVNALNTFGLLLAQEETPEVTENDISSLVRISQNDSDNLVRSNATHALAIVACKNLDLIPEDKLDQIEHLCAVNRDSKIASANELKTMNEALGKLVTVSGLEEVKLLLELEGHPSKEKVEKLIRKKDRYRDAIGPLLNRIEALYQANKKLEESLQALTVENLALKQEGILLKQKIKELTQELTRIKNSIRSKRVQKTLLSIGGTAFRNIAKGRGVAHREFVKSIFIDAGWDQFSDFLL